MADTVLGKVSCVPRGDYNAGTTYYALDIVGYQGGSYLAMKEVTGVTPGNDQVNWMQLSGPGLPGEQGPQGNPGTAAGFGEATATVDETTGTPSVEVETSGPDTAKVFSFAFSGLKGETGEKGDPGDQGIQGIPGVAAGFGTPTATVDDNVGTPGVTVQASGPDTAKVFSFAFVNLKGETGAQGDKGDTGDTGPQGPEGPQGPKGDTGTGLDILGTYDSLESLQAAVQSPSQGDMYNVGAIAPYTIYMWDTTDGSGGWESQGQLQGPRGEQGPQGDPGPQGEQGPRGEQGIQGPQGDTGPEGPQGPAGADGAPGAQGPAGENGGYYSPAVDASGNLMWAASKEGMPAVSGTNIRGPQGKQGPRGPAGQDGAQGPAGQDGAQGPEGPQGPKGDPGDPGAKGDTGPRGPAGAAATINGVNTLNIVEGDNITLEQSGSTLTINASGGGIPIVTTSGTGSAYTATVPGITELTPGTMLVIVPHVNSSASAKLNVNGLGAKTFYLSASGPNGISTLTSAKSNALQANVPAMLMLSYDEEFLGLFWQIISSSYVAAKDIYVSADTDYTTNRVRGMSFRSSTPSTIPNGCSVGVYE